MSEHSQPFKQLARRLLLDAGEEIAIEAEIAKAVTRKRLADSAREQGLDALAEIIDTSKPQFALDAPKPRRGRPPGSKNRVNSANHVRGDRYYDDQVEAAVEVERNGHEE